MIQFQFHIRALNTKHAYAHMKILGSDTNDHVPGMGLTFMRLFRKSYSKIKYMKTFR